EWKLEEAVDAYRGSLAIRERLAHLDPANAQWQRDLSVSYNKIGDVLVAQEEREDALTAYRTSLVIREMLVQVDAANTEWQRDLIVSYVKVSALDLSGARTRLSRALSIGRSLQRADRLAPADVKLLDSLKEQLAALPKTTRRSGRSSTARKR